MFCWYNKNLSAVAAVSSAAASKALYFIFFRQRIGPLMHTSPTFVRLLNTHTYLQVYFTRKLWYARQNRQRSATSSNQRRKERLNATCCLQLLTKADSLTYCWVSNGPIDNWQQRPTFYWMEELVSSIFEECMQLLVVASVYFLGDEAELSKASIIYCW